MTDAATLVGLVKERRRDDVVLLVADAVRTDGLDAVVTLLADVQTEIGRQWETRQMSIADEHASTAIIDLALTAATLAAGPSPTEPRHTVVVACAEDEWHVLPARMLAERLGARGWQVVFLGASMPAGSLGTFVSAAAPAAVALSCSVALHLPGARRSIAACHDAGVAVMVGGAAFGGSPARAAALGADGWAAGPDDAAALAAAWQAAPPALAAPAVADDAAVALESDRRLAVDCAMAALAAQFRPLATYSPYQLARTREDFDYIVRFTEAALLAGDDTVVTDFARWLASVLSARDLPPEVLPMSIQRLYDCVPEQHADARRLLLLARRAVTA